MTDKKKISVGRIFIYAFLILLVAVYILPLLWIVLVSLKTNKELLNAPFSLPEIVKWENYKFAWKNAALGTALRNSTIVCTVTLVFSLLVGSMAAFAIGRMKWKLSNAAMTYFLLGMMIPVHCVLISLYTQFAKVGLRDSLISIIIPYVTFALPITIYIMVGFFRSMPTELFEAACIDGCSIYRCFFTIALPLSKTGLFVTGLMTFVGNWNELLLAMVFISDKAKRTLPIALTTFSGPHTKNYVESFAAIIVAILPNIIVYSIFSNQIVEGLTVGAVKG